MTAIEQITTRLDCHERRLQQLESIGSLPTYLKVIAADRQFAEGVAQGLGVDPVRVFENHTRTPRTDRRALITALQGFRWSRTRIARTLNVSEEAVRQLSQ